MPASPPSGIQIRPARPDDTAAIHALLEAAFERADEADLAGELRQGEFILEDAVACDGERVVGYVAFSVLPIEQPDVVVRGVALAPLAVDGAYRGRGIGAALVDAGLEAVRRRGADAVVVLGEPEYYGRFGFSAELGARLSAPFSGSSFMALELMPATLSRGGRVCYPPPFGVGAY